MIRIIRGGWERGYFRDNHSVTVAETDLGRIGMLICWDSAHPRLWRRYAGQVDLMVITSCPPNVSNPTFCFPDGQEVTFADMGPAMGRLQGTAERVFGGVVNEQTAWLGVPTVHTVGCGVVETAVPNGRGTLLTFASLAPWLLRYWPQANEMRLRCPMTPGCKVVGAEGEVLAALSADDGEMYVVAEVALAEKRPYPVGPQPKTGVSPLAYLSSDYLLPWLTIPTYRRGLRRVWGSHMAPVQVDSYRWGVVAGLVGLVGLVVGFRLGRRK